MISYSNVINVHKLDFKIVTHSIIVHEKIIGNNRKNLWLLKLEFNERKVTSFKRMVSCIIKSLIYVCIYDSVHVSVYVFISSFKGNNILHLLFFYNFLNEGYY